VFCQSIKHDDVPLGLKHVAVKLLMKLLYTY